MYTCPECQAQMLEYLYDLLDQPERQAMQAHLADCAPCRAELAKAENQQKLLATAARMEFPNVRFLAPEERMALAVMPLTRPVKKTRPWRRWAVAAAVLLALAGLSAPGYWMERDYAQAIQIIAEKRAVVSAATQHRKEALAQLHELPRLGNEKIEEVLKKEREAQLRITIRGPAAATAGAPTTYELATTNLNGEPVPANLNAHLEYGETKQAVGGSIPIVRSKDGNYRITLPADLPLKPQVPLTLWVSGNRLDGLQSAQVSEKLDLAAPVYITHLDTDKPMYKPGEVVHYRSLTLDRFSMKPAEEDLRLSYELVTPTGGKQTLALGANGLIDSAGAEVRGPDGKPIRGVGAGELLLEANLEGGEYTLVCREEADRFPPQRRKFLVNNYPTPQLNKKLDFNRSTYGPGDEVSARCTAFRANGDPVRNQPVEATVLIDDQKYGADGKATQQPLHFKTDDLGTVDVHFKLPAAMERGQASLGVTFLGNPVETIARPLPIVLKKLNVEFYPEGGDLAADLPNRVYFQVRTTLGKPADLTGTLFEDGTALPTTVQTLHDAKEPGVNQGEGRFEFTPKAGKKYELQIDSPIGITGRVPLPEVKPDGVALSVPDGVAEAGQPIKAVVHSIKPRDLLVGLYCRGRLLHSVQLKKGETEAVLSPTDGAGGVCRVTVFEETSINGDRRELKPVAERLVYRQPAERLSVNLRPNLSSYVPGQKVQLGVEALNEKGEPAPAVVMLAVVDKSVLTLADEKTYRQMPTHFLLTSEVRKPEDLEYADFLLGPQAKAMEALDLLLGVQGWRRFAEQNPDLFRERNVIDKEEAESILIASGQSPRQSDGADEEIRRIQREADAKTTELTQEMSQAQSRAAAALGDTSYATAVAKRDSYWLLGEQARLIGTPLVGAVLLIAAIIFLIVGLVRGLKQAAPWYVAAVASVALLIGAILFYRTCELKPMEMGGGRQLAQLDEPTSEFAAPPQEKETKWAAAAERFDDNEGPAQGMDAFVALDKAKAVPPAPMPAGAAPMEPGSTRLYAKRAIGIAKGGAKPGDLKFGVLNAPQADFALKTDPPKDKLAAQVQGQAKDQDRKQEFFAGVVQEGVRGANGKDGLEREVQGEGLDRRLLEQGKAARPLALRKEAGLALWELQERRQRGGLGVGGFGLGGGLALVPPAVKMVVREYAHEHTASATPEVRSDFAETLCWRPVLVLPNGRADVSFDLSDSATTFQALAFAHTLDGRLGAGIKVLESRLPFALQPAVPIEVTSSDKIDVPLSVANNTPERRNVQVTLKSHGNLKLLDDKENAQFAVDAGKTARPLYRFQPSIKEGEATLEFTGVIPEPFAYDGVRAKFHVAPEGFPIAGSYSDVLEGSASQTVTLPETWVNGTLKCQVQVYPSTLADLQKGLDSLLREPNGCFEQTSTSNYPNLLILDYLKESNQTKPEVERHARELLGRGYTRLTSFECTNTAKNDKEGYEWFGGTAPAHEALTAYGLLQFRDMARVRDVDPAMLKRTQDFLMSRRDGKGGFLRNPAAIDSFGRAPDDVTNAYIVWALTESGKDDDLKNELDALAKQGENSKDPYFLSLVANSLINRARTDEGVKLLQKVVGAQKEDGHLDAEKTSITGSGGRDLEIETTALAVLGWLKANPGTFNAPLQKAIKWIGQQRGGYGGFGSTQSTILALKALIAYTKANKRTAEGGEVRLYVGDKEEAKLQFAPGASEALTLALPDAEKVLKPGANAVRVEMTGKNTFPYTLAWTYQTLKPVSADDCPVRLETKLSQTEVQEGGLVRLNVTLKNVSGKGQGMATAILGLPGGVIVPEDMKQLKQYTRVPEDGSRPLVSAFEIRGRELVLYWRDLAPDQTIQVPLDLIARIPGEYSGPASRGYLYYNADHKDWVEPLRVKIAAKMEQADGR